jgi:hypothetical protein
VLGLPCVEELAKRVGPEAGRGRFREPPGQPAAAALGGGPHGITEIGIEQHTQLVQLDPGRESYGTTYRSRTTINPEGP